MSTALLRARGLRVATPGGDPLLGPLDLDVAPGERLGIVGRSGAGKSLTVGAVLGTTGSGLRQDGDVTWASGSRTATAAGALFQESASALDPLVRAGRQVGLPLRGLTRSARRARVLALAEELDLPREALRRWPGQLSGGQRQRLALALALVREPALVVADEPTAALDTVTRNEVATHLDQALTARGAALLLVSHDLGLVARLCSRVVVIDHGQVVEDGPVEKVVQHPAHPVTAALVEASAQLGRR